MKKLTMKTLLVALGLAMGVNVWADEGSATVKMTYINGSEADTSYGEVETAYCGYNKISGGKVELANSGWGVNNIAYLQVDASAIDGTITAASLQVACQQISARGLAYGVGYNTSEWSSDITWNTADRSITTIGGTQSCDKSTADKTLTFDISDALVGDADKIATILVYQTAAGAGYVKNPIVTITYKPAGAAYGTITTKYQLEDGTAICDDVVEDVTYGESYTPTKKTFVSAFYDYTYKEGANTIASVNDDAEIIIVYTKTLKAAFADYTIHYMEDYLPVPATTTGWSTNVTGRYDPIIVENAGDAYMTVNQANRRNNGATVTGNILKDAVAAGDDFTLQFDVQLAAAKDRESDITTFTINDKNNAAAILKFTASATGSTTWKINESETSTATLEVGAWYTVKLTVKGSDTYLTITKRDGNSVVFAHSAIPTLSELGGLGNIVLATARYDANLAMDNILVRDVATGDVPTVTKAITSVGYATYCSTNALDFSNVEGLTAYRAVVDGEKNVTFVAVTKVPAGEGVLLKGDANTYEIPVIGSADAIENAFVGVTEETVVNETGIFVLMASPSVGFYRTSAASFTVSANSAYLPATASARSFIGFDDEATGIRSVVSSSTADDKVFNLQGQRVAQPTKGLFIMGGKKVVKR